MDEVVKQAMAKWPQVPDCYGWLGLDARGHWYLRDERAQAAGPFDGGEAAAKGSWLRHDQLIAFIGRNYAADGQGRWFFQNGPQRVFVELAATPWIWRLQPDGSVRSHTGAPARVRSCVLDEEGRVYLETDLGFGLVHTQDVALAAEAIEAGHWLPLEVARAELPRRFGYVTSPQRDRGTSAASR